MPPDQRPDRRLEVLQLRCRPAESAPDDTRLHVGCQWRPAEHPDAVGYRLWRIVDRGQREPVTRDRGADCPAAPERALSRLVHIATNLGPNVTCRPLR